MYTIGDGAINKKTMKNKNYICFETIPLRNGFRFSCVSIFKEEKEANLEGSRRFVHLEARCFELKNEIKQSLHSGYYGSSAVHCLSD